MDKIDELRIKLDILEIIKNNIEPNFMDNTTEISIEGLANDIEKIKGQIDVLQEQEYNDNVDEDMQEIIIKNIYADGKLIKTETEYKYKQLEAEQKEVGVVKKVQKENQNNGARGFL